MLVAVKSQTSCMPHYLNTAAESYYRLFHKHIYNTGLKLVKVYLQMKIKHENHQKGMQVFT